MHCSKQAKVCVILYGFWLIDVYGLAVRICKLLVGGGLFLHRHPDMWCKCTTNLLPYFQERMKTLMTICFKSVKHKLAQAVGFFELLGFDFMLDANMNVNIFVP
jgi:hypothetical protein